MIEPVEHLAENVNLHLERKARGRAPCSVLNRAEQLPLEVFHRDEAGRAFRAHLVRLHDVRMAEAHREPSFVQEHPEKVRTLRRRLSGRSTFSTCSLWKPEGPSPVMAKKTSAMPPLPSRASKRYLPKALGSAACCEPAGPSNPTVELPASARGAPPSGPSAPSPGDGGTEQDDALNMLSLGASSSRAPRGAPSERDRQG